jgi:hypothetical protein
MIDARNRGTDTARKGPVGQRQLLDLMKPLIAAAMSKAASRTRDDSRRMVRRLMAEANWNTPFVLVHLGAKRCRYLSSLGYVIDSKYLAAAPGDVDRLNQYEVRRG